MNCKSLIIFFIILFIAAFFRFYGVDWDQNQHLHPDERFLTMVTGGVSWPNNIHDFLDTKLSPLNPHNRGFSFFVYGTFPLFITKFAADLINKADYIGITLIGRKLSALFDLGTVIIVFFIARQILKSSNHKLRTKNYELRTNNYFPHLAMLF